MAEIQKIKRARIQFKGEAFTITVPDEGQALALVMVSKSDMENDVKMSVISSVMATCLGTANWTQFITGLATKKYTGSDLMDLMTVVMETAAPSAQKDKPAAKIPDTFGG